MKAATATTTAISHGFTFGFQGSTGGTGAAGLPAAESPCRELERFRASSAILAPFLFDVRGSSNDSSHACPWSDGPVKSAEDNRSRSSFRSACTG